MATSNIPAMAASPGSGTNCGTIAYPSGGANGQIVPIKLADGTVIYAKFTTDTSSSTQSSNTSPYNATFGRTAYGSTYGNYTISSTNNFVFNQLSTRPSTESVTVTFYKDSSATQVINVTNATVPINDVSTGVSWSCGIFNTNCSPISNKSYQDVVKLTAKTSDGSTVGATITSTSGIQTQNATAPSLAGNLSTGAYFPVANALATPNSNGTTYGGTVNTTFGSASISSFTFTYSSNIESATSSYTGAQGVSMGPFAVCV
ncbi:MAG: hypothetical protein Q3974_01595 [Rothia sp. (in: high G+C Gram-positive bacteria)]|nr:hypothetical protein [Rothia sp. (in: high G+C Gram-positive bacteria)]